MIIVRLSNPKSSSILEFSLPFISSSVLGCYPPASSIFDHAHVAFSSFIGRYRQLNRYRYSISFLISYWNFITIANNMSCLYWKWQFESNECKSIRERIFLKNQFRINPSLHKATWTISVIEFPLKLEFWTLFVNLNNFRALVLVMRSWYKDEQKWISRATSSNATKLPKSVSLMTWPWIDGFFGSSFGRKRWSNLNHFS